jgi:hypothetical protein
MRLIKTFVCVFLAATAAQAAITTANVKVQVTGKRCSELKVVYLVINGEDPEERWVLLESDGPCHWKADLGDGTISTANAKFSFRAGLMRSGCQKAAADEKALVANVEFSCCAEGTFRNVGVKIDPAMPVSYVRYVQPFPEDRIPGVPCREAATFFHGHGTISNAQFEDEKVFLGLGPFSAKRQDLGILLNDLVVDNGVRVLTRDGVVYRLSVQRAKGTMGSSPTFSSNAIALDIKKLGDLKFERAEFQVIK